MDIVIRRPDADEISSSGYSSWPIWECQPSRFDWHYDEKETCLILEGEVTVETDSGEVHISPGDLVVFPEGLSCRWIVHSPVRKHYRFG